MKPTKKLTELETHGHRIDAQIEKLRTERRKVARAIEAETQRILAARTPVPGPVIG